MHDSMSDMRFWDCCVLGEGEIGAKMSQAMISRPLYIEEFFFSTFDSKFDSHFGNNYFLHLFLGILMSPIPVAKPLCIHYGETLHIKL